jgi:hypothetical protein
VSVPAPEEFTGWRVLDPDGNVIASDPRPIVMEATSDLAEAIEAAATEDGEV